MDRNELIEHLTEPLASRPEAQAQTRQMLEPMLGEADAQEWLATARGPRSPRQRFRALLVLWLLVMAAFGYAIVLHWSMIRFAYGMHRNSTPFETGAPMLPAGLKPQEVLLLGDPELDDLARKKRLLDSEPDNPAYYEPYVAAYLREHRSLPPDYQQAIARLDPDNASFVYLAATEDVDRWVESVPSKAARGEKPRRINDRSAPLLRPLSYRITDRAAYEEAISLLQQGSRLPRCETYTARLAKAKAALVPSNSYLGSVQTVSYGLQSDAAFHVIKASKLICARADELATSGDAAGFRAWCQVRERLLEQLMAQAPESLIHELICQALAMNTAVQLHEGAQRLQLADLTERYARQRDAFQEWKDWKAAHYGSASADFLRQRGSMLAGLSLAAAERMVRNPPPLDPEDLKPLRLAEHDFYAGIAAVNAAALMIALAVLHLLARCCMPAAQRLPAVRIASLLTLADWFIISVLGVGLPIALHLLITRETPLGGRDYGVFHFLFLFPTAPLICTVLGTCILSSLLIQWRLRRLLPTLFPASRSIWWQWSLVALLLFGLLGSVPLLEIFHHGTCLYVVYGLPAVVLLIHWLGNGWRASRHGPIARLQLASCSCALQMIFPLAAIAFCATLPIHKASEASWSSRDRILLPSDPNNYEHQIALQARKELLARLGSSE